MVMDAKDLRIESTLGASSDDGNTKYAQSGTVFQTNGNKPYHDIGPNSLAKVDVPTARPCAIIGPDRVLPPQSTNDAYIKKVPVEPWPCTDSIYQHPPEYPYKHTEYQLSRNISPRQTFQENMQRIMVPPSYASVKNSEEHCLKNSKLMSLESKFCDVPYTVNPINNEPKIVKSTEGLVPNNSSNQPVGHHGWTSSSVNMRPLRPYGAPDLYQYAEYPNCPGPRPISMIRPHRNGHEDVSQVYQDRYHDGNIRYKPYPTTKERPLQIPHSRYDYIPNYPNAFHTHASYPPHKYELQKSIPPHSYSVYPPVPLKYLERRMPVPTMEKYARSPSQQVNFNQPFCNQNIPSSYGTVPGNCLQSRAYPYAPDPSTKSMIQNRLYFDSNSTRKYYTSMENMYINDINRTPTIKNDILYPSYPPINIHTLPPHHMYRKESSMKGYEHAIHYKNIDYSTNVNPLGRLPLHFSPQTMSISPSDSNTSNDTAHILGNSQDDCGYASQSTTGSLRSIESGINRISSDIYRRHEMTLPHVNKFGQKQDTSPKEKKNLNVRQFLQMWNEGDDEGNDNNKETTRQKEPCNSLGRYESGTSQEQLYVLDLVNVPKEELGKYDHIQKISKLPENIKGYNSIELLNQYEKLVESPGLNQFSLTPTQSKQKDGHVPIRNSIPRHGIDLPSNSARPLSPLDVEAKISQSVIHKEVGCNFEIRPCSPQMMNVELATPVHNLLHERLIEKVVNPINITSALHQRIEETNKNVTSRSSPKVPSCKMASNHYPSPNLNDSIKTNYCLQDLESNSGVCLASLPRLDNDIELNFPEINQQFINANKTSSIRDLPILDTENCGNTHKSKSKVHSQPFTSEQLHLVSESEKDVSKLSKYRKQKRNSVPNDSEDTLNNSLHRTDSVIIKNPENGRSQEDYMNVSLINSNVSSMGNLVTSMDIPAESDRAINYSDKHFVRTINDNFNSYTSMDSDTAIDFSLNKSDDEQNSSINGLNHLNDALQNNTEINKNICISNETIYNCSTKLCNNNSPKQPVEIATPDNISPVLDNFTSSNILNNIVLQSPDEDNQALQIHETVITHSKPKEIISDIPSISVSSLTAEILPQNDLLSLNHETETVTKDITCDDKSISENIIPPSEGSDNQALNYCLAEQPDGAITPISECKYDLFEENQKACDNVNDSNGENNSSAEHIENNVSSNEASQTDSFTHPDEYAKNNRFDDLTTEKSENESFQTFSVKSKDNELPTHTILQSENDVPNENIIDFKTDDHVDFTNHFTDENHVSQETNVNKIAFSEPFNCTPHTALSSVNDFNLAVGACAEINIFENDESHSETRINNIAVDIITKNEISSSLRNVNSNNETIKATAESGQVKYVFAFNKEMFSPRVQNLLIHNEGLCTSANIYLENNPVNVKHFYNNIHCLQSADNNLNVADKSNNKEKTVNPEIENNTNTHIITVNNAEILSENKINDTTECVENGTKSTEAAEFDTDFNNIDIDLDKVQQIEMTIKGDKNKTVIESSVVENYISESVAEEKCDDKIPENKVEINIKCNNLIKEKNVENLIGNQLLNRRNRSLKRSLSESAVNEYIVAANDMKGNNNNIHTKKRAKTSDSEILVESQVLTQNLTNFIQNNRRNSISTIYNDENVSFCIFIENDCVITEDTENCQKICYTELPDECLATICTEGDTLNTELIEDISYENTTAICSEEEVVDPEITPDFYYEDNVSINTNNLNSELDTANTPFEEHVAYENNLQSAEDRTIEETWVDDVACMETVFSDDVAEDIVISAPSSPKDPDSSEDESINTNFVYNVNENEHTNKVKHIYGNQMCDDDAQLVEKLYRTPQMDVNKTLIDRESHLLHEYNRYYDNESLEKILTDSNTIDTISLVQNELISDKSLILPSIINDDDVHGNKENLKNLFPEQENRNETNSIADLPDVIPTRFSTEKKEYNDCLVHSCESTCDNFVSNKKEEKLQYAISSSPEVSSTTSEEKGPGILLKIRNYKGSKISEVNEMSASFNLTHSQRFKNNSLPISRPLITKAAQKYIPPLKETINDLKVKIRLPKQSLYKLQQLKKSKEEPKIDTSSSKHYIKSLPRESPKKVKPKPKFEDVLMSIDEIQFKKHKEKNKRIKQSVPKVIIKKNENGAHYASTQTKETFNPDLTGRKWQPWVFLEKSNFVDKMALKHKFKAIYSHRKKTYVLAENFRKYKSISNAKFVISHPKSNDDISSGKLKYTFRLKH